MKVILIFQGPWFDYYVYDSEFSDNCLHEKHFKYDLLQPRGVCNFTHSKYSHCIVGRICSLTLC